MSARTCVCHTLTHPHVYVTQIRDKIRHEGIRNGVECCCVHALSSCSDFQNQKNSVEELVESLGHQVIFLPKFHPELNFIERFWSRIKWWLRGHCLMTMDGLLENVRHACSTDVVSLTLIRKYARTSWRWMEAYRRQLTEEWSPELTVLRSQLSLIMVIGGCHPLWIGL